MASHTVILLICFQICFIQNAFSQCATPVAAAITTPAVTFGPGLGVGPVALKSAGALNAAALGPAYSGAGVGNVAVAGELPVGGSTLIAGQVPVIGAVRFDGVVPAAGIVSISGVCGCGCNF